MKTKRKKRILIACEKSRVIQQAFENAGCDAWSCDIQPGDTAVKHYQGDVLDIIDGDWDMMIAHPCCRYLSYAGNRWRDMPGRKLAAENAMQFFLRLWHAPIKQVCLENPLGLPGKLFRPPDQIIHPYFFGDPEMKRTCLWLRGLNKLEHYEQPGLWNNQTHTGKPVAKYIRKSDGKALHWTEWNHGSDVRSRTFPGIAKAMASQWQT